MSQQHQRHPTLIPIQRGQPGWLWSPDWDVTAIRGIANGTPAVYVRREGNRIVVELRSGEQVWAWPAEFAVDVTV